MRNLYNVMRVSDRALMLGQDVSKLEAIAWNRHYNSLKGIPYPNGEGFFTEDFVVCRLDIDLCEYLSVQ